MQEWADIRNRVLRQGVSKRQILRETGMHHSTLRKILENTAPPGYRQSAPRVSPKLGPHVEWVKELLKADQSVHKKQRHTAHRIFQRLRDERGYTGGETVVKGLVRELVRVCGEVFMPLAQTPGEAQVDFFEALVRYPDSEKVSKVHVFAMHLPYSDMFFLKAYERECAEVFQDGHVSAFEFFGGVPSRISYDNLRIAVSKITGSHSRELTPRFLELRSHYLFESHFCNVRSGNEKGCVEGLAKYARRNFLVPVPQVADLAALNAKLADACKRDGLRVLRGKDKSKAGLLAEECLSPLPVAPFEACKKESVRATSLSLIRFDKNDYSVPVAIAHHPLVAKGFVEHVSIFLTSGEEVARHARLWGKEGVLYDFRHYLPLLESKPGALDYAAPFADLTLPKCFEDLRRRLESGGYGHRGTKDYIGVLRLLEKRSVSRVTQAVEKGLTVCQRPTVEVVCSYLYGDERPEAMIFRLGNRPQLAGVRVALPDLSRYGELTRGEGQA